MGSLFLKRMLRASQLDATLYEEVEADKTATQQAFLVVLLSSIAGGIGAGALEQGDLIRDMIGGSIINVLGWLIWAFLTYWIGTTLFKTDQTSAHYGELLRTIGFAASPGAIRVFGMIPVLRIPVLFIASLWSLLAMIVAVRQALDFTTRRAVGTCFVGWCASTVFIVILLGLLKLQ